MLRPVPKGKVQSFEFPARLSNVIQGMRKTKIIATLGPATESPEVLGKLLDAGMNVARLNMSHAQHSWVREVVKHLRAAATARGKMVGILMDTQGPAIRTGELPVPLDLKPGEKFTLTVRGAKSEEVHSVDVNYDDFVNDIRVGDVVLIDNGQIRMKVLAKDKNKVECEVLTPGKLGSRRHINLPGVKVSLPALTAKDRADLALGRELQVDFVALSFVREAKDIEELRQVVEGWPRKPFIVAKVEDQQAVAHFEEIANVADGIMVARGDLGIEVPFEELPIIQRRMVKTCLRIGKPVIVATHMLESMISSPMPTRAEVTDVSNAVFEQADAIMLSGETSVGRYPVSCIEVFDRIAARMERSGGLKYHEEAELVNPRQKLAKSAVVMANELRADAMILLTTTGKMGRYIAWMRPRHSAVYALCPQEEFAKNLTLIWGLQPYVIPFTPNDPEKTIDTGLNFLRSKGLIQKGQTVVIVSSIISGQTPADAIQMRVLD
ncbi:MAG TPA: pyruvate kinase [Verrucomicrobiae bacterium]|nr:pyruvate kinase [Verrucomicrobiae bacterium]